MTASSPASSRSTRFLFAMFQGGGNIPLILPIAAALVARGHSVRVPAGPGVRRNRLPVSAQFTGRIAAAGATLVPFQEPEPHPLDGALPSRGIVRGWTPHLYDHEIQRARVVLWSPAWADNVAAELRREPADVLAADFELFGALAAAEAVGVPAAVLVHNVPWRATPGTPPRHPGFLPARGLIGRIRDAVGNAIIERIWKRDALPAHNHARRQLGLPPMRSPFEQYDASARVLVLTSQAFDFVPRRLPPNVRYVGTPFDDSGLPPSTWQSPGSPDDARPLILVSLSTMQQGQAATMHRVLDAVAQIQARVVVTLGPSLDASQFTAPPNVTLETFVPHAAVLPHVATVVTQCGLGTTMKALAHEIPLVCIPLLGDQPDNAARVVARGAGVRLGPDASPEQIRAALQQTLDEPSFRDGARRLGRLIAAQDGARTAADEIESLLKRPA